MLNPFPTMWLSMLAYFILRICIGYILIRLGIRHLQHRAQLQHAIASYRNFFPQLSTNVFIAVEFGIAGTILLGYYTQYACLVGALMCLKMLLFRNKITTSLLPSRYFYFLLLGSFLSLFITGAGAFAFDLPI